VIVAVTAAVFVINRFFVHRELWDWLELLIVPAVLAGGGLWFNAQQRDREQQIATQRAQDEALQAYLDQMSDLLIPTKDQPSLYDEPSPDSLRAVARTLTVLPRLDGVRKGRVMQFLSESRLMGKIRPESRPALDLSGADLSGADLHNARSISNERLVRQASIFLEGATMPNGQKYEDWVKDREGRGEDG
jgi:hypothetical protein